PAVGERGTARGGCCAWGGTTPGTAGGRDRAGRAPAAGGGGRRSGATPPPPRRAGGGGGGRCASSPRATAGRGGVPATGCWCLGGWPVISEYALTFIRKPGGVRSAHPLVSCSDGGR